MLFEGRDAAGKGGVIKRITQRLNPRVCRVGRAARAERARAHAVVFPALRAAPAGGRRDRAVRPQLVQPRRRRARDGLLHRRRVRGVLPHRAGVREDAGALGHRADQVLVLDHRRRAAPALPDAHPRPAEAVEARARWTSSRAAAGSSYTKAKEIMLERTHIPEARWWVVEAVDKKRARLNCIHHLLSQIPYQEVPHEPVTLPARVHNPDYSARAPARRHVRAGGLLNAGMTGF